MYAIDRLNRLLRHYGMSEEITGRFNAAIHVEFHKRLNALDRRAGKATRLVSYESDARTSLNPVGARLALHEELIGAHDAPAVNAYFWLGRDG